MDNIILILLGIIVALTVGYLVMDVYSPNIEGFFNRYNRHYKRYCKSCGWRSVRACAKCINCGVSVNQDGKYECVPGDKFGPYFRLDTVYWIYDYPYKFHYDPYYNKIYRVRHRYPKYSRYYKYPTRPRVYGSRHRW